MASPLGLATKLAEDKRRAAGKVDRGKYATAAAAKAAKAAGSGGDVSAKTVVFLLLLLLLFMIAAKWTMARVPLLLQSGLQRQLEVGAM